MASKKSGDKAARDLSNEIPLEFKCRAVATAIGAYTASGGTLTVTASGALASQDGVAMAAGDMLFLQEGLSNVTAADAGPYRIVSLGGASAQVVLSRPAWWPHGGAIVQGAMVAIGGEGSLFGGCTEKTFVATGAKIGTDAPAFWPDCVMQKVTLASGTLAAAKTNMPVRSATTNPSQISITSLPTTAPHATTRLWRPSAVTAGVTGTASIQIVAESAPGSTNTSDIGDYCLAVRNWG